MQTSAVRIEACGDLQPLRGDEAGTGQRLSAVAVGKQSEVTDP